MIRIKLLNEERGQWQNILAIHLSSLMKWQEMLCGKGTSARLRAVVQSWIRSSVMNLWVRWGGKQKSVLSYITSKQDIPLEENDMWKHIQQVHSIQLCKAGLMLCAKILLWCLTIMICSYDRCEVVDRGFYTLQMKRRPTENNHLSCVQS